MTKQTCFVLNVDPRSHLGPDVFRSFGGYLFHKELTRLS